MGFGKVQKGAVSTEAEKLSLIPPPGGIFYSGIFLNVFSQVTSNQFLFWSQTNKDYGYCNNF